MLSLIKNIVYVAVKRETTDSATNFLVTFQKNNSVAGIFLWVLWNLSEQLCSETPPDDAFSFWQRLQTCVYKQTCMTQK